MNKYKEAKAWLDKINANPHWNRVDIEEPALSQLNELFEKATPKEPFFKFGVDISMFNGDCFYQNRTSDYWICPNCDGYLCNYGVEDSQGGYCPHCGQALDWGWLDE